MPVYTLPDELIFPHPVLREPDGLMAVGGDLSPDRLLLAYRWGIFPWYSAGEPICWWWLSPRLVLKPGEVQVSHSLKSTLRRGTYEVTFDKDFSAVINSCASVKRKGQRVASWITPEMRDAYIRLHGMGYAHSVEVWKDGALAGGLYGVALGRIFTGESMFAVMPDASKVGFVRLAHHLASRGFQWIDCQQDTPHMRRFGGKLLGEEEYLEILRENQVYLSGGGSYEL